MAKRVKIAELQIVMEAFAKLYAGCGATDRSTLLLDLSAALEPVAKQEVDKLIEKLREQPARVKSH